MSFLYHIVKADVEGGILYPLNALKDTYPSSYLSHSKKYENRKHIPKLFIPQLECYWGDVIHLSAIHPKIILQKLHEAGSTIEHSFSYYEINPMSLDPTRTIVYPNTPRERPRETTKEDFVRFDSRHIEQWSSFPEATLKYYKSKIADGKRPLLFLFVPHILYKGSIDVSKLERKHIGSPQFHKPKKIKQ